MRLIIVGNGFDQHHQLKTSYKDYCAFLKNRDSSALKDIVNSRYFIGNAKEDVFWTDVEKNLRFDYKAMMDDCKHDYHPYPLDDSEEFPDSTQLSSMKDAAEATEKTFEKIYAFTTSLLFEWISGVNLDDVEWSDRCRFKPDDLFVTFNYTLTLETVYAIKPQQVIHIHGSVDNKMLLQFGNTDEEAIDVELEYKKDYGDDILFEQSIQPALEIFVSIAEHLLKDLTDNISKLERRLPYDNIDEIVVMGHSYRGSDFRYYKQIFIPKFKKAKWVIYCWHGNPNEVSQAEEFFKEYGLNGSVEIW